MKREEKIKIESQTATSSKIKRDDGKDNENIDKQDIIEEEIDDDWIKSHTFPSRKKYEDEEEY